MAPIRGFYAYYRCAGSDKARFEGGRICYNPPVRVDQLDEYVWDSVKELMQDPERVLNEWVARAKTDTSLVQLKRERDEAEQFLRAQEKILARLRDAFEAGALELEELVQRTERVRTRIQKAKDDLNRSQQSLAETVELTAVVGRLADFSEKVRTGLNTLNWHERRQLIRTLVARVEIDEDGATVVYRVPAGRGGSEPVPTSPAKNAEGSIAPISQLCCSLRSSQEANSDCEVLTCGFHKIRGTAGLSASIRRGA